MDNRVKKKKKIFVAINVIKIIIQLLNKKRKRSKKKYWVRPMLLQRKSKGHFNNLFQFIKNNDNEQFFKFTRMTVRQFEVLLEIIQESLRKKSIRESLSPEHRLCITL